MTRYNATQPTFNYGYNKTYFFHLVTITMSPSLSLILGSSVQGGLQATPTPWLSGHHLPL